MNGNQQKNLEYKPPRSVKPLIFPLILCIVAMAVLALLASVGFGYRLANHCGMIIVGVIFVELGLRYAIYEYTYALSQDSLAVIRVAGRIPVPLLTVEINGNDKFIRVSSKKELKSLFPRIKKVNNVCKNLRPAELYAYVPAEGDTAALFECDSLFAYAVEERINLKKRDGNDI